MSDNARKVAFAVGGLVVGALLVYFALRPKGAEDEERPPIIVKGGSVIFQSGDPDSTDPDEKTGKPWKPVVNDWQPDHPAGKQTKRFAVQIIAANQASCPALSMTKELTMTFTPATGPESEFKITTKERSAGGTPAPTVIGNDLATDNKGDNPKLIHDKPGMITRVRFQAQGGGNVDCPGDPALRVIVWQF